MTPSVFKRITTLPLWAHGLCAVGTLAAFQLVKGRLDASYAASLHPVDYFTGQTSFSAETIKGYYASMQDTGTLDIYRTTQIIDFGFLFSMGCIGIFVCTLIARLSREGSFGRRAGLFAGFAIVLGATCDAIENGWSFVMLANPEGFADWLAYPYSGFASVKFALITLGMLLVLISILSGVIGRVIKKPAIG